MTDKAGILQYVSLNQNCLCLTNNYYLSLPVVLGDDYNVTAGVDGIVTVTFANGTVLPNFMMLPISIQSDQILEGDESFTVSVVEVIDAAEDFIVVDSNVDRLTLTINDDEGKLAHGMEVKPPSLTLQEVTACWIWGGGGGGAQTILIYTGVLHHLVSLR